MLVLVVLCNLALMTHGQPTPSQCTVDKKCINCLSDGCRTCKYMLTRNDKSCGSGLTGNCEVMYERDNGECALCMEGYSLSKDKLTCQKTAISGCIEGYFDSQNVERCRVCKGYYPSSDGTKCDQTLTAGNCTYAGVEHVPRNGLCQL